MDPKGYFIENDFYFLSFLLPLQFAALFQLFMSPEQINHFPAGGEWSNLRTSLSQQIIPGDNQFWPAIHFGSRSKRGKVKSSGKLSSVSVTWELKGRKRRRFFLGDFVDLKPYDYQ